MDLSQEYNPVPKKTKFNRKKPKGKDRGKVTPETYAEVAERDGDCCVYCGKHRMSCWTLDAHHAIFSGQGGPGKVWNLALACGPVTESGTCHYRAHAERKMRKWFEDYLASLYPENWGKPLPDKLIT